MKISYLFSKNGKIGSLLIQWASSFQSFENVKKSRIPSHVAILVDDQWVIESTFFTGVRIIPVSKWAKKNELLYLVERPPKESKVFLQKATSVWDKPYDWCGILFFTIKFMKLIMTGEELPKENPWQGKNHYFCTELIGKLESKDYSMTTPAKLCDDLKKEFKDEHRKNRK